MTAAARERESLMVPFHCMQRSMLLILLTVAGTWFAPGRAAAEFDPWKIPPGPNRERLQSIALRRVAVPFDIEARDETTQAVESAIARALEEKGYAVVASRETEAVWLELARAVGPIFDSVSGEADASRLDAVREHMGRELAQRHGVDAVLRAWVVTEDTQPYRGPWDNAFYVGPEALQWEGKMLYRQPQRVLAAHLNVVLEDLAGTKIYSVQVRGAWASIYAARGYEQRPDIEVYRNDERNLTLSKAALQWLAPRRDDASRP